MTKPKTLKSMIQVRLKSQVSLITAWSVIFVRNVTLKKISLVQRTSFTPNKPKSERHVKSAHRVHQQTMINLHLIAKLIQVKQNAPNVKSATTSSKKLLASKKKTNLL